MVEILFTGDDLALGAFAGMPPVQATARWRQPYRESSEVIQQSTKLYIYEVKGFIKDCRSIKIRGYLGNWPEPPYNYLFFLEPVKDDLRDWLSKQENLDLTNEFSIDYGDWQQVVRRKHRVGRFVILPGFTESLGPCDLDDEGLVYLYITPCLVFGSGLHPTTSGCLAAIDHLYSVDAPETATDIGTGTGILAIACAKCGTKNVVAYDINPLAVECAKDNVRRNKVNDTVTVKEGDGISNLERSELLCFNLDEKSFRRLIERIDLREFRWSIISGMLEKRFERIAHLLPSDLKIWWKQVNKGWITICVQGQE